ncbi:unnamed protein product [Victoria cruziana]
MGRRRESRKSLTVAPFECAWRKELKFRDAGRGCISFDAFAQNDVTVVFRERAGSRHYNYKMDSTPNYTVILGSHRNKRLKIEVSGKTVVDVAGVGLCSSSSFESYWISIYDGLISIGKGRCPFENIVFQWFDSQPTFKVQYIGLSSWDKHVGYRNVCVLSLEKDCNFLERRLLDVDDMIEVDVGDDDGEGEDNDDGDRRDNGNDGKRDKIQLEHFLESWDLSDVMFVVGAERKAVPAHSVILRLCGSFYHVSSSTEETKVIKIPWVGYPILHALLKFIYTGRTQILESELETLRDLSREFQCFSLVERCEEIMNSSKRKDPSNEMEILHYSIPSHCWGVFPYDLPLDIKKLRQLLSTGEGSDVDIYIDGYGVIARAHKLILSLWSTPFFKMFTNGMKESNSKAIRLWDVSPEAFLVMLRFMYGGDLELKDSTEMVSVLIPLLFLVDQFGVNYLHNECCKNIIQCLSEDLVCPVLQVVSSLPSCLLLQEACEKYFAMHFDYCTTANTDFVMLSNATFTSVLEHPYLTVTSEEKVLDAVLLWCMQADKVCGWQSVDELLNISTPEAIFAERLLSIRVLLPLVRFPLMSTPTLRLLESSNLSRQIPVIRQLVEEALSNSHMGPAEKMNDHNARFQHRATSFKQLRYICDGDNNGVMYYSGTSYGKHQWVNPVIAKRVTITASSPTSRYTDPKALTSRAYQATSFTGPHVEGGQSCAWWMVDLGQEHQLMCNFYTMRQDGSTAYPRYWSLEGSLDGEKWTTLRSHENDQTICKPSQFASWPVNGPNALLPFRFFRIILTGRTTANSSPWNFCICFLELYGYFR